MTKMAPLVISLLLVTLLSGCVNTSKMKKKVTRVFTNEFTLPPERELQTAQAKPQPRKLTSTPVMVMVNTTRNIDDKLGIEKTLLQSIIRELDAKGMSFRADYTRSQDYLAELVRVLARSSENYQGEVPIDYDLHLKLHESSIYSEFDGPGICLFNCEEKRPGECTYHMKSNLQIEVTGFFPQKTLLQSIDIRENDDYSTEAFDRCPRHTKTAELANAFSSKTREMRETLAECAVEYLHDILAPEAYIKSYFSDGETHLFSLTAGSNTGLIKGEKVTIQRENPSEPGMYFNVADGKIVHSQGTIAYIELDDSDRVFDIKRNHRVKLVPSSGLLGKSCSAKVNIM